MRNEENKYETQTKGTEMSYKVKSYNKLNQDPKKSILVISMNHKAYSETDALDSAATMARIWNRTAPHDKQVNMLTCNDKVRVVF